MTWIFLIIVTNFPPGFETAGEQIKNASNCSQAAKRQKMQGSKLKSDQNETIRSLPLPQGSPSQYLESASLKKTFMFALDIPRLTHCPKQPQENQQNTAPYQSSPKQPIP